MAILETSVTTDVFPWPEGQGFEGARQWWAFVLCQDEPYRLNVLIGIALLDSAVERRLIYERDDTLLTPFQFSTHTLHWLKSVPVNTLAELAQAVLIRWQAST